MVPFAQIQKEFEQANPDINVEIQAHGSIQVIRQVTELGQDVDIVAVADYSLIPMLMYQTMMPNGKPYAELGHHARHQPVGSGLQLKK